MHRLYAQSPPHDRTLYDNLQVAPNATAAQITQSYRRLSRRYHPDKQRHVDPKESERKLDELRRAYDILKDDQTRLPYHRYGLTEIHQAAVLLTGGRAGPTVSFTPEQRKLLKLMGYDDQAAPYGGSHQQRVIFLAANLIERLRPLVEGAISDGALLNAIAQECDSLKKLPLGAQILRCIGRAYRHTGQAFLRKHSLRRRHQNSIVAGSASFSDRLRETFRDAKQVATAAVVSGALVVAEKAKQRTKSTQNSQQPSNVPQIEFHDSFGGPIDEDEDEPSFHEELDNEIRQKERQKANDAVVESLQIEALWKVSKIELDRTIREACKHILAGNYFFFPMHQSVNPAHYHQGGDGWVGSQGRTISFEEGRLKAAAALVQIGNVMVQCSKEGTSWRD